jgi:hypothetical protein
MGDDKLSAEPSLSNLLYANRVFCQVSYSVRRSNSDPKTLFSNDFKQSLNFFRRVTGHTPKYDKAGCRPVPQSLRRRRERGGMRMRMRIKTKIRILQHSRASLPERLSRTPGRYRCPHLHLHPNLCLNLNSIPTKADEDPLPPPIRTLEGRLALECNNYDVILELMVSNSSARRMTGSLPPPPPACESHLCGPSRAHKQQPGEGATRWWPVASTVAVAIT